jgi:hypothetical protein
VIDIVAILFVDVHLHNILLTLVVGCDDFIIQSIGSEYSLWLLLQREVADISTNLQGNASYDGHNPRFDIAFHGI